MEADQKKSFPLRAAYDFAAAHGLANEVAQIRDREIDWDRPYTSSVRRGFVIRLFEQHRLLDQFIENAWHIGATPSGATERRRCLRLADDFDEYEGSNGSEEGTASEEQTLEFALEAHLRDFLARHLDQIEPGLSLFEKEGKSGVEYAVAGGRIDLLAVDKSGRYVVIELKLSQGRQKALGQLLYYMGWVDEHLGSGPCRGIIVASTISDELSVAVARAPDVTLARYSMKFSIESIQRK